MKPTLTEKFRIQSYFDSVQPDLARVDKKMTQQVKAFDPNISGYVEYAVEHSGKRIRPALVLLTAKASGGSSESHLDLAVILELVHLATLVHDDILDNAGIRRGMPTMKAKWGTEISVLLGDCLFAHALKLCTRFDDLHIARVIAAASNEVCTGEIIQTQRRFDLQITMDEYLKTIRMKTGALFRVATELSAYLNGLQDEDLQAFSDFGEQLGTAYQIYDDCLDLMGEEDQIGKTLGTDLVKGKLTLPVLHMLRQLSGEEREKVSENLLKGESGDHVEIVKRIHESGGFSFAVRKARELLAQADKSLESVEGQQEITVLRDISRAFGNHISTLG
ncbi:MAG: polyprenyl synthetase family protein [Verrucomicrobiota bacterium]